MTEVKPAYFDNRKLSKTNPAYVCWLDVMGSQNAMLRSVQTAANFVCKIHDVVLGEWPRYTDKGIELYPVMDGVYITSARQGPLRYFLSATLRRLAETFLQEQTPWFRFLVRGCVAFGPLVAGKDIQRAASHTLADNSTYRDSILIGIPLVQAYRGESKAPPFGIYVDESARAFAGPKEEPFSFIWWDWYTHATPPLDAQKMHQALQSHFDWYMQHTNTTGYETSRIEHHSKLADEYFNRTKRQPTQPRAEDTHRQT